MPRKFTVQTNNGPVKVSLLKRFSYYINGRRYWFAVHENIAGFGPPALSHWESGLRIATLDSGCVNALFSRHDYVASAKRALDRLIEQKGADSFAQKLDEVEANS